MALRPPYSGIELCSGVGMLGVGVKLAIEHVTGCDAQTVCHVERDAYAASALVAGMEDAALEPAPIWDDLCTFDGRAWRGCVDWVAAGFPCQPWSVAGAKRGTDDERWLWPAIVRIIRDAQPSLVFLENVPGLVSGGGLHHVLDDLAEMGFDAEWGHLRASEVGASHRRERVFILAYGDGERRQQVARGPFSDEKANGRTRRKWSEQNGNHESASDCAIMDDTASSRRQEAEQGPNERIAAQRSGQCVPGDGCRVMEHPERPRLGGFGDAGTGPQRRSEVGRSGEIVGDAERTRREKTGSRQAFDARRELESGREQIFAPGPGGDWRDIPEHLHPATQPGVCVLVDGVALVVDASRADQLRCGGNGVVPLQAAAAFVELMRRAGF